MLLVVIGLCFDIGSNRVLFGELAIDMEANIKTILAGFIEMSNILNYTIGGVVTGPAEGMVVKTNDSDPRVSFKVISNRFSLKHSD